MSVFGWWSLRCCYLSQLFLSVEWKSTVWKDDIEESFSVRVC